MKILLVTYDIPWPLDAGGKVRAYNLIKILSKEHDVSLFTYYRNNDQLNNLIELKKLCTTVRAFKRMPVFSAKHVLTALSHPGLASHIAHYYHSDIQSELAKELSTENYDVLHLESFYTSHMLGNYPVKQVLGTENIEYKVYKQHANQQPMYKKIPFLIEARRTKNYEIKTWKKADAILAVSEVDADVIKKHTNKPVHIVPNGVDTGYFKFKPRKKTPSSPTILFVGNFAYIQNQDAALYLAKEIFPLIKKKVPKAKLLLVGRKAPTNISELTSADISLRSDIEDIREAYYSADVLVAPIRAASGTQFKLLEAMASGLPVITTRLGAKALVTKDNMHIILSGTLSEFAKATINLLHKTDFRNKILKEARTVVEDNYSWSKISNNLVKTYNRL